MNYSSLLLPLLLLGYTNAIKKVIDVKGEVNVALLISNCQNATDIIPYRIQSLISSALWITERVNFLDLLEPLNLGLSVYETCTEIDYYKTIFNLYQQDQDYFLGIIIEDRVLSEKVTKFCEILNIRTLPTRKFTSFLMKASVEFVVAMEWMDNITVLAPSENILNDFLGYSKNEDICVKDGLIYGNKQQSMTNISSPIIYFGSKYDIENFVKNQDLFENAENPSALFVPLDGSVPTGLPNRSFVVIPPHVPAASNYQRPENILTTPTFFEVAKPLLSYTSNIERFVRDSCNDTIYKLNCLRNKFKKKYHPVLLTPSGVTETLRIEPLRDNFIYSIYMVYDEITNITDMIKRNNFFEPYTKIFSYNIFNGNLTREDVNFELPLLNSSSKDISRGCISFSSKRNNNHIFTNVTDFNFRSEAWVYAFLSLSLLGVLFCVSILIFILLCICRRDILEGNPILTLVLLISVMILFCSILPFSLETNRQTKNFLCIAKALSITLGYAMVFSLLLSRCILLATAAKDIGFMSHIAGPVQAFLALFIFGVQAALSLQVMGRCVDIFRNNSFVYLMSYNAMLLLLLLCLCPLIYKCQRNYREGKYFTAAIVLSTCIWTIWMPLYVVLDEEWKEPMLCLGLIGTAGIFLGTIFIPRTYHMTISAARDKITSTLPSLATATSTMDIYRTNAQPIYDCVNVAAINTAAVARARVTTPAQNLKQPDLYTCPTLPEDEVFDFRCDTPTSADKVTRF